MLITKPICDTMQISRSYSNECPIEKWRRRYLELSLTAEFFRAMLRDRNYFGIAAGREQYISIGAALYICEHFLPPKLDVGLAMN